MTVETRYLRSDQHTVNGLTAYVLGTSQTTSFLSRTQTFSGSPTVEWGIRVWRRAADGTETEVTSGTPVAVVSRAYDGSGLQSATWNCPQTSMADTDAIVVRVYVRGGGSWILLETFITEQLGAGQLDAATWTVYYWTSRQYVPPVGQTSTSFRFGDSTYNSRIEGFSWSVPPPPVARRFQGDGLTLIVS